MYGTGYNKIFWGMIFITVNINLGPIDILPNFIGYLLILSGLSILEEQHSIYKKGRIPALILSVLSLKDFIAINQTNILFGELAPINLWVMLLTALTNLINLYLIYIICRGIYLLSIDRGLEDIKQNAKGNFKFYFILELIFLIYSPFSLNMPQDGYIGILFTIMMVNFFAVIGIIMLFRRARNMLID